MNNDFISKAFSSSEQEKIVTVTNQNSFYGTSGGNATQDRIFALCIDICKRNGKKKLLWFGDKTKSLTYNPKPDEMVLTVHRWFANKSCPGDWLYAHMDDLAQKVTAALNESVAPTPKPIAKCPLRGAEIRCPLRRKGQRCEMGAVASEQGSLGKKRKVRH